MLSQPRLRHLSDRPFPAENAVMRVVSGIGACVLVAVIGCGIDPSSLSTSVPTHGVIITGKVETNLHSVSVSQVTLYAAGNTGVGSLPTSLVTATTDATGAFATTNSFICPTVITPVYVVARGGSPVGSSLANNAALVWIAALGDCGTLAANNTVTLNEVTTVAATWALQQFVGNNAAIGSSATNLQGLRNAFAVAEALASTRTGTAPGEALPSSTRAETAKLNTLANALTACASSNEAGCSPLFQAATINGVAPSNTLDAALNIVRHPASNVAVVRALTSATATFTPVLSAAPHDWTMSIVHGVCASGCGGLSTPSGIAIDGSGNAWVANYSSAVLSEFSPIGIPASTNGFPGVGLRQSYGVAIDTAGDVWIANQQSVAAAQNSSVGSASKFNAQGAELSGNGYTSGGLYYPQSLAADSNGSIWFGNYGNSSAALLSNDGSALSPTTGFAKSQLYFTSGVAVDANHNAWFSIQGGVGKVTPNGGATTYSCCSAENDGIAVDALGNVWLADYGAQQIVAMDSAGAVMHRIDLSSVSAAPQLSLWMATARSGARTTLATQLRLSVRPPERLLFQPWI